jgi:hypothetical protein
LLAQSSFERVQHCSQSPGQHQLQPRTISNRRASNWLQWSEPSGSFNPGRSMG